MEKMETYDVVKVFSATKSRDRAVLGEQVTEYLRRRVRNLEVVGKEVRLSSDREFHCLSITLFLRTRETGRVK